MAGMWFGKQKVDENEIMKALETYRVGLVDQDQDLWFY